MSTEATVYAADDGVIIFHCGGTGTFYFVFDAEDKELGTAASIDEAKAMIAASNSAKGLSLPPPATPD